jgi:hypothetical protein
MFHTDVRCECRFQLGNLRPHDELAMLHDSTHPAVNRGLMSLVLGFQVNELHKVRFRVKGRLILDGENKKLKRRHGWHE